MEKIPCHKGYIKEKFHLSILIALKGTMDTQHDIKRIDFLDFISLEERNLLATMANFRREFDIFFKLDAVYKEPLYRLSPNPDDALVPQLYFFVHFHLFFSIAQMMRVHLSEALGATRKAIDGALTAYELILRPERSNDYVNQEGFFRFVKQNIKKAREKDSSSYSLAADLVGLHELCSQFGSHADISTFVHRMEVHKHLAGATQVTFDYFQKPKNDDKFRYYFLSILQAFLRMFLIFKVFFDREFHIVDPQWESKVVALERELPRMRRAAYDER